MFDSKFLFKVIAILSLLVESHFCRSPHQEGTFHLDSQKDLKPSIPKRNKTKT